MRLYNEILWQPSAATTTVNSTEVAQPFDLPKPDRKNPATVIRNGGHQTVHIAFGERSFVPGHHAGLLALAPGEVVLLQPGDGGHGDAASTATKITVAGRSTVTVTRGVAVSQQIFANR